LLFLVDELQSRLQTSLNTERVVKDESITLRSKLSEVESEISSLKHQNEMVRMELEQRKTEKQMAEQDLRRYCTVSLVLVVLFVKRECLQGS
jgi:uncharacterized protein (DUF3084 family)